MQNQNTSFYKPTKFGPNEKGIENYQTAGKETIAYKKLFAQNLFDGRLDNKAGFNRIRGKANSFKPLASKLKEGEFAVVERRYSEIGMFDFTTRDNNKIHSHEDVAFIFRQLESEAVEQAFAVYIDKDLNPSVQWLSMGGVNATVIDPRIMVDAAQRLEALQIYLVHNHPSGSLKPSSADLRIIEKLKKGFAPMGISVNAIIINLNSGNYLIFDENGSTVERDGFTSYDFEREQKVGVFSFNKQAFLQTPFKTKIQSPSDAAQFLSQQKFSSGQKAGYLLLTNRNEIVGNFFATQNTRHKAFKEVAGLVSKFGAVNVIAYTNKADNAQFYRNLKTDLTNLEIDLLDVIECESSAFVCQTFDKYKSLMQQSRLYETSPDYYPNPSKINEAKFNIAAGMETQYDIAFGHLGSGITVWDRQQIENHDYKTIAHISDSGQVNFYDNNLPEDVKKEISNVAANVCFNNEPPQEEFGDNTISIKENQTNYITKNSKTMDTQNTLTEEHLTSKGTEVNNKETYRQMNLDYLTNQVKFLGFGEGLGERLSEKMNELKDTIDLPLTQSFFVAGNPVKKQDVDFSLHFNKGKESNMYFLNSYSAQLKGENEESNMPQKFYINKGKGITAKEAFNLLSGRAINKDFTNKAGETYNAWVKLNPSEAGNEKGNRDFQMFSENYGFDLEKTLSKYPVKEMESPDAAERLMSSLKKGNMQTVTFVQDGEEAPKFISANPQFKNLNVFNHDGSVMFHNNIEFNKSHDAPKQNEVAKTIEQPVMKVVKPSRLKR